MRSVINLTKLSALFVLMCSMKVNTEPELAGKTYIAKVGETCKSMTNGGCMIYTLCVLKFEKDSVAVSYRIKAACSPKEMEKQYEHIYDNVKEKYKWAVEYDSVKIENFNRYGILIQKEAKLIGKIEYSTQSSDLEFVEEFN